MEQNLTCIVTGAKRYSFEDKDTKKQVEGTKVHFLQLNKVEENDAFGFIPAVTTMPYEYFEKLKGLKLPHLCDAILNVSLSGSRPQIKVSNFVPRKPYPLTEA